MTVLREEGAAVVSRGGPAVVNAVEVEVMSQMCVDVLIIELDGALAGMVEGTEGRVVAGAWAGGVGVGVGAGAGRRQLLHRFE